MSETLLALVGPTASGKSQIAIELSQSLGCEIVAADSMTVYRGLDIGTAKPTPGDRSRVVHHLVDVVDPGEPFSVARYQRLVREAMGEIRSRGHVPLVAGGSGLYFRAAVDDLDFPPTDRAVRARIETDDTETLAARLKREDPGAAELVDLANRRRVVRALEVIEITGCPFSSFRDAWGRYTPAIVAGLAPDLAILDARIERRLHEMIDHGLLDEVRGLIARGYRDALVVSQAIPYRQAVDLAEEKMTQEQFFEQAARATRRLARRQLSWFRRDPRVRWFDAIESERAVAEVGAYYNERMEG
ncbi:MAG TPA: tRNA (adenosine(37)-N6)-dimethylallyltransferase MiaA [Actinomycetota bacterium]|nr:tRNA (adenosine(37)-N6)-dimethylallyltransferase MiaA [Actinomycetota bacterium]